MSAASRSTHHQVAVHWFRKGLRLDDNPALLHAINGGSEGGPASSTRASVYPLFVLDPWFARPDYCARRRYEFLLQSLRDLDAQLRRQHNSRLWVVRGDPLVVLPRFVRTVRATLVTYEYDSEPYARERDRSIADLLSSSSSSAGNVTVSVHSSHTLHCLQDLLARCPTGANSGNKEPPLVYQSFIKIFNSAGPVPQPRETPAAPMNAAPADDCIYRALQAAFPMGQTGPIGEVGEGSACTVVKTEGSNAKKKAQAEANTQKRSDEWFAVPDIQDILAYATSDQSPPEPPLEFEGGETAGLQRLRSHLARTDWIGRFEKPQTSPNALQPSTTVLSPYLKFGCVSVRRFWHGLQRVYAQCRAAKSPVTSPPVSLEGQLLWREMFYLCSLGIPNFHRMQGNPVCRQIAWRDPVTDAAAARDLAAWTEARTGYPFIDACMTQLRKQGWLHHLARHAVACFLTRGDLFISWEHGYQVFQRLLLDEDYALNAANWMWLSASCFFYQYFRVYSPVAFGKKTDPIGEYIRHWLPQLRAFPQQYIYEPWLAPSSVQQQAGCVIGRDYPSPIVVHADVQSRNKQWMADAYARHNSGAGVVGGGGVKKEEDVGGGNVKKEEDQSVADKKKRKAVKEEAGATVATFANFKKAPKKSKN